MNDPTPSPPLQREAVNYMRLALRLAVKGRTSPNPRVGAVVVREGEVVGRGYHPKAGEPHAEVFALDEAGEAAKGADLYVTLEPCSHHGRTPPCCEAVIRAGIARVYVGMVDPDEKVAGRGVESLRNAGIEVVCPVLEDEARGINEAYIKHRTTGLPLVILKSAMSLDGRTASRTGDSKWITGEKARAYGHRIRAEVDAIMVGAGTVRADNPSLTARVGRKTSYPKRVIMTCKGGLPDDLAMLKLPGETFVAIAKSTQNASLMKLEQAGARILEMEDRDGRFSVEDVLRRLAEMGVLSVLIEGGAGIAGRALDERVVDKALFFYAPKIIGGDAAVSGIGGEGVELVSSCPRVTDVKFRRFGEDFAVEGRVEYPPL